MARKFKRPKIIGDDDTENDEQQQQNQPPTSNVTIPSSTTTTIQSPQSPSYLSKNATATTTKKSEQEQQQKDVVVEEETSTNTLPQVASNTEASKMDLPSLTIQPKTLLTDEKNCEETPTSATAPKRRRILRRSIRVEASEEQEVEEEKTAVEPKIEKKQEVATSDTNGIDKSNTQEANHQERQEPPQQLVIESVSNHVEEQPKVVSVAEQQEAAQEKQESSHEQPVPQDMTQQPKSSSLPEKVAEYDDSAMVDDNSNVEETNSAPSTESKEEQEEEEEEEREKSSVTKRRRKRRNRSSSEDQKDVEDKEETHTSEVTNQSAEDNSKNQETPEEEPKPKRRRLFNRARIASDSSSSDDEESVKNTDHESKNTLTNSRAKEEPKETIKSETTRRRRSVSRRKQTTRSHVDSEEEVNFEDFEPVETPAKQKRTSEKGKTSTRRVSRSDQNKTTKAAKSSDGSPNEKYSTLDNEDAAEGVEAVSKGERPQPSREYEEIVEKPSELLKGVKIPKKISNNQQLDEAPLPSGSGQKITPKSDQKITESVFKSAKGNHPMDSSTHHPSGEMKIRTPDNKRRNSDHREDTGSIRSSDKRDDEKERLARDSSRHDTRYNNRDNGASSYHNKRSRTEDRYSTNNDKRYDVRSAQPRDNRRYPDNDSHYRTNKNSPSRRSPERTDRRGRSPPKYNRRGYNDRSPTRRKDNSPVHDQNRRGSGGQYNRSPPKYSSFHQNDNRKRDRDYYKDDEPSTKEPRTNDHRSMNRHNDQRDFSNYRDNRNVNQQSRDTLNTEKNSESSYQVNDNFPPRNEPSPMSSTVTGIDEDLFNELNMTQKSSFIPKFGTVSSVVEPSPPRKKITHEERRMDFDPFAKNPNLDVVLQIEAPVADSPADKKLLKKKAGDIVKKQMQKYYQSGIIKDKEEFKNLCRTISHKIASKEKLPHLENPSTQLKIQKYIDSSVDKYLSKKKKDT